MQALRLQNQQLRSSIQSMLEEIQNQKEINAQHQTEIQTLLQFNERLLAIIQKQVNNNKDSPSLQPISQRSERESDLLPAVLSSLIKAKKMTSRSQKGKQSQQPIVMDRMQMTSGRLNELMKQRQYLRSEQNKSYQKQDGSQHKLQYNTTSPATSPINSKPQLYQSSRTEEMTRTIQSSKMITEQMNKQIAEFKKYRKESATFYNNKIDELKNLSSRITNYRPMDQLSSITSKLPISKRTAQLINNSIRGRPNRK